MKFAFERQCILEHVNNRKSKNEDAVPHYDLKFSIDALPAECVALALGGRSAGEIEQVMFAAKELRFKYLDTLPVARQWEGQHMLRIDDLPGLRVLKLHKLKISAIDNGFQAIFTCTVEDPDAETLHAIMHSQHESVQVNLEHDRKDLADQADDKAAAEKKGGKVKKVEGDAAQTAVH